MALVLGPLKSHPAFRIVGRLSKKGWVTHYLSLHTELLLFTKSYSLEVNKRPRLQNPGQFTLSQPCVVLGISLQRMEAETVLHVTRQAVDRFPEFSSPWGWDCSFRSWTSVTHIHTM